MNKALFHIIIIDDNPDVHRDFIKILRISNEANQLTEFDNKLFGEQPIEQSAYNLPEFEIDTASQGEEGVAKVKKALETGHPFALAFVDIRMPPGIDGIETIKKILELDNDIQIVICTAYSDYSWEDTIKNLGMSDNLLILKKPFDIVAVKQLTHALTNKWLITRDTKKHTASLNNLVDLGAESLKQSLALLRATIEASSDGILVVDLTGKVVDYNKQFVKFWNVSESMLTQNNNKKLLNHMLKQLSDPTKFMRMLNIYRKKIDGSSIQIIKLRNNRVFECYSKPHRVDKRIVGRVWSYHDITEQVQLKEKLEYQATHDALTGLPNRSLLVDRINQGIAHASRYNTKLAIIFLDIDFFKWVNDSLSHAMGDLLLRALSVRLSSTIRLEDTIARLGGDEFILVFPLRDHGDQINTIINKLLRALNKPFLISHHKIKITVSLGISIYPIDATNVYNLLSQADLSMYQAKALGGNQFVFYTEELNKRSKYQFQLASDLQHAIDNKEFFLEYQPQFDIKNQKILSIEALLRWQHPEKGVVYPNDFISVAESSSLIIPIGDWVIQEACRQITVWHSMGLPLLKVAVNVATKQLRQPNFSTRVEQILQQYQLESKFLEIEITENIIVDLEIRQAILKLKEIGCKIILDDFGTGNSSLNALKQLHIDRLKIDRSFVKNIAKSRGDEAIIEAVIAISHSMNFKVIAEGIENQQQIEFLRNKKCDVIQGYLWSKPLSAQQLGRLLKKGEQR